VSASFILHVERIQPGCAVPVGQRIAPLLGRIVIGRSSDADVTLEDVSVSRLHLELRVTPGGFAVKSLTATGSTFVNSQALADGDEVVVDQLSAWLQIGRILMRVKVSPATLPVAAMPLPVAAPNDSGALVTIERGKAVRVWLGGQAAHIFPSAARVLARLCEVPSALVTHEALLEAVDPDHPERAGGALMAQLVTYARDAFAEAIEHRWIDGDRLRRLVIAQAPEVTDELAGSGVEARRALLRALICNKRGLGYVLNLPPSAVTLQ